MKIRIISVIVIIAVFASCLCINGVAGDLTKSQKFTLNICEEELGIASQTKTSLAGIKVDVYSSKAKFTDEKSQMLEFVHTYAFTVVSDANGNIAFDRPSDCFLIIVDVASLPRGTGVDIQTKFYSNNIVEDILKISTIDKVIIESNMTADDGILVKVLNEKGAQVHTAYTVASSSPKTLKESMLSDDEHLISGKVIVGDIVESYEYSIRFTEEQRMDYVIESRKNDTITQKEALEFFLDLYSRTGKTPELIDQVNLLQEDTAFYQSLTDDQKDTIAAILAAPSYNKTYSSGYFVIRYTSSSNETPAFILSLMSAIQAADESLVDGLGFDRPKSNWVGVAKYHIYVTSENSESPAYTCVENNLGTRTSYIVIPKISESDLNTELTLFRKGTVAHEYMHAITHAYHLSSDLPRWFKESWSDWAAVRVFGISSRDATRVNNYLDNTYKTFTDDGIAYGKFLYPLFIKQNYGGDATVANAVKNLSWANHVTHAITDALPGTATFESIFAHYMGHNYAPKYFYNTYSTGWSSRPFLSSDYDINSYPNNDGWFTVFPYAAHYRDFDVPRGNPYTLHITINMQEANTAFSGRLHMTATNGSITDWTFYPSGQLVTYVVQLGGAHRKGGMSLINSGSEVNVLYRITMAIEE